MDTLGGARPWPSLALGFSLVVASITMVSPPASSAAPGRAGTLFAAPRCPSGPNGIDQSIGPSEIHQSMSGQITACIRVGPLSAGAHHVELDQVLLSHVEDTRSLSTETTVLGAKEGNGPPVALRLSPASGAPVSPSPVPCTHRSPDRTAATDTSTFVGTVASTACNTRRSGCGGPTQRRSAPRWSSPAVPGSRPIRTGWSGWSRAGIQLASDVSSRPADARCTGRRAAPPSR